MRCVRRWNGANLAAIAEAGRGGKRYVGKRPRCTCCEEAGALQVRPPWRMVGAGWPMLRTARNSIAGLIENNADQWPCHVCAQTDIRQGKRLGDVSRIAHARGAGNLLTSWYQVRKTT